MEVQVFGTKKSAATRAALRFFAERRVRVHFVDLDQRPASPGELRRFVQRFGVDGLVDVNAKRYQALGLGAARRSEDWWIDRLAQDPLLLQMPLVRHQKELTVGQDEAAWRAWVAS